MKTKRVAAIDIGSHSIRMTIYEIQKDHYQILEELRQTVRLGKDCFYGGKIARTTIDQCVMILKNYKRLCREYKVNQIIAVATTAVREAVNMQIFTDNILTLTGIEIELLSPLKESEYIYQALYNQFKTESKINTVQNQLIIEVGSGSVEITLLKDWQINYSRTLPLGTLKIKQLFLKNFGQDENFINFLTVIIDHELKSLKRYIPLFDIHKCYAIGSALYELTLNFKIDNTGDKTKNITRQELEQFISRTQNYSEEEIIHKLKIPYDYAEIFIPACITFSKIIRFFNIKNFYLPEISLRDGLIERQFYVQEETDYFEKLENQLTANALNIGRSLNFDENHAVKVMQLALQIYDQTYKIHHLDKKERCYLIVASLLHDIGASVSYRSHHKHSLYIINAQSFFSLDKEEVNLIANVARYHRKTVPKESHPAYIGLSQQNKIKVLKLSAILRIADSLDNSHLQLIEQISLARNKNKITITALAKEPLYAEIYSFKFKKILFESLFGINIKLILKDYHTNAAVF